MAIDTAERAHIQVHRLPIATIELQETLGQRLTAVIAGASDAKAVGKWAQEERAPHTDAERRHRDVYPVMQVLLDREGPDTVRVWFTGMNPLLDNEAPGLMLARVA
ncbi:MAG: XRE family transcriptional regulator [Chloroflexota bacterium]